MAFLFIGARMSDLGEFEAANRMGVTVSSLKAQLHRSRRILTCRIPEVYLPNMSCSAFHGNAIPASLDPERNSD